MSKNGIGRPTKTQAALNKFSENIPQIKGKQTEQRTPIGTNIFLPNQSGDHSAGKVRTTPVNDLDIANKKYVDDNVLDWTVSQAPSVIHADNYTDTKPIEKVSVYLSGSQTLVTNVYTKILFDTEVFDTNNHFANSTFTAAIAGYYLVTISGAITNLAVAHGFYIFIYKNGSSVAESYQKSHASDYDPQCMISKLVYLDINDTIEGYAQCNQAADRTLTAGESHTFMTIIGFL